MKKILVVLAAITLASSPLFSQEADGTGAGVEFTVIPRINLAPEFYNDGSGEFALDNTSLYTLFEGNISENLSFSVENHWMAFYYTGDDIFADTKDLYKATLKRRNNWLDWANLTWTSGDFSVTLGKDVVTTGGYEVDEYDFDMHSNMSSTFWNFMNVYQWGAKFGWNAAEDQLLTLQVTTSPFVEKLFDKPWMNYSLGWSGMLSGIQTLWSVTAMQTASDKFFYIVSLGNKAEFGDFTAGLDLTNASMQFGGPFYGITAIPSLSWKKSENLEFFARCGYEHTSDDIVEGSGWFAGAGANWFPIEDLRVHATASYNDIFETTCVSLGATWFLRLGK